VLLLGESLLNSFSSFLFLFFYIESASEIMNLAQGPALKSPLPSGS